MQISPQRTSARRANSTSKFILGATAAAVFTAVLVGGGSAAAEEIPTSLSAVIEFPPGLTMRTLETPDARSILITGCPAGGAVTVENQLEFPLGNGETSSLPVSFLPALNVPDGGVVALPLLPFAEFFNAVRPTPQAQFVVAARCAPDGPWASRRVPLNDGGLGATRRRRSLHSLPRPRPIPSRTATPHQKRTPQKPCPPMPADPCSPKPASRPG